MFAPLNTRARAGHTENFRPTLQRRPGILRLPDLEARLDPSVRFRGPSSPREQYHRSISMSIIIMNIIIIRELVSFTFLQGGRRRLKSCALDRCAHSGMSGLVVLLRTVYRCFVQFTAGDPSTRAILWGLFDRIATHRVYSALKMT
jgi:hypothetical protein